MMERGKEAGVGPGNIRLGTSNADFAAVVVFTLILW